AVVGHPRHFFAFTTNTTTEVEAPGFGARIEGQGLEGNLDLGDPAVVEARRLDVPDGAPVRGEGADVLIERVVTHRVEVGLEAITGAPRVEGIEDQHQTIIRPQPLTMPNRGCRDQMRLAIVHDGADVECVFGIDDVDDRGFGRLGAVTGTGLVEVGDG